MFVYFYRRLELGSPDSPLERKMVDEPVPRKKL